MSAPIVAAALPAAGLRAWCPSCLSSARRAAARTAKGQPPQTSGLFDLPLNSQR